MCSVEFPNYLGKEGDLLRVSHNSHGRISVLSYADPSELGRTSLDELDDTKISGNGLPAGDSVLAFNKKSRCWSDVDLHNLLDREFDSSPGFASLKIGGKLGVTLKTRHKRGYDLVLPEEMKSGFLCAVASGERCELKISENVRTKKVQVVDLVLNGDPESKQSLTLKCAAKDSFEIQLPTRIGPSIEPFILTLVPTTSTGQGYYNGCMRLESLREKIGSAKSGFNVGLAHLADVGKWVRADGQPQKFPNHGDILVFDSSTKKWVNKSLRSIMGASSF